MAAGLKAVTSDIVVADDLTGAADTVVQFLRGTDHVLVFPSLRRFEQAMAGRKLPAGDLAIGISTESRHLTPAEAAKRVRRAHRAALALRPRLLFQKVDSALRGNPGAELAAYRTTTGAAAVLMTPAFLPSRRIVRDGMLFVDGVPLAQSAVAADLRTPAIESSVPALLRAQCKLSVAALPLAVVRAGRRELAERLPVLASGIALADAEMQSDLTAIAQAVLDAGLLHAVSGSAGLAGELSGLLPRSAAGASRRLLPGGLRVLAVIGSPHALALAQIDRAASAGACVVTLEGDAGPGAAAGEIARRLEAALLLDGFAIVRPPPLNGVVGAMGATAAEAMARALTALAALLLRKIADDGEPLVQALVVSGGDVAAALCDRLAVERIELLDQVFPGAPLGRLYGGPGGGLPIVTKSGAHGAEDGLLRIVSYLRGAASPGFAPALAVEE